MINMGLKRLFRGLGNAIKDSDKVLLSISIVLCLFGLFNIVNVSSQEAQAIGGTIYYYFYRQFAFVVAGLLVTCVIISRPMNDFKRLFKIALFILIGLNFYVMARGSITRGASNWIGIGIFKIQPSELSKPVIIACLAFLFEKYTKRLKNAKLDHTNIIFKILVVSFVIPFLVVLQKDIGTATIITITAFVLFWFSPILKKERLQIIKYLTIMGVVIILGAFIFKGDVLTGAQRSRLDFFDPCDSSKFQNGGYQVCNAFIAINRGGLTGVGIGKSTQKYSYIPEPHTDMVFAIISEEYGFIVGIIIIFAYFVMIYRIINLSTNATSISGRYMCLGVGVYISAHIFINLGGMFGLIPLTGVPLPFLSYGGSFLISLIVSLAMVQRVHIDTVRTKKNII